MGPTVKRGLVLWGALLVPSLVGWGALIQLSAHGRTTFATSWRWLAHLLAVPLILAPLTDRCFAWLAHGGVAAFAGFLLLLALWALMIALPITLLLTWATWLGHKLAPTGSGATLVAGGSGTAIPYATTVSPASRLFYLITIPLALLGLALRYLLASLRAAIAGFVLAFLARFLWQYLQLLNRGVDFFYARIVAMDHLWHGLYARAGFHHLFAGPWRTHFTPVHQLGRQFLAAPSLIVDFRQHPEHYPDVFWLLVLDATMFALLCAVAVWALAVIWRIVTQLGA